MNTLWIQTDVPNSAIGVFALVITVLEIALRPFTEKDKSTIERTTIATSAGAHGVIITATTAIT